MFINSTESGYELTKDEKALNFFNFENDLYIDYVVV